MTTRVFRALVLLVVLCSLTEGPGSAEAATTITIVNVDGPGEGFNDPTAVPPVGGNPGTTLGQQRLNAFQGAANIWALLIQSDVPIRVQASFDPLACTATAAVLGAAGPIQIVSKFPGEILDKTWYPVALANSLAGIDLIPGAAGSPADDIVAFFNSSLDNAACLGSVGWYYGLDNNHGTNIDLVTVLLHEFGHGLGFLSLVDLNTGKWIGPPQRPDVFSAFVKDLTFGQRWTDLNNPMRASSIRNARNIVWDGPNVTASADNVLDPGTPFLRVNSPASIADTYLAGEAAFGPPLTGAGTTGSVVLADDGTGATSDACEPLVNVAAIVGNIALVDRGTCTFVVKATNAQAAGAIGVIVADNVPASPPPSLGGTDPAISIPSIRITVGDGLTLKSQLASGVNATMFRDLSILAGASADRQALLNATDPIQPGSSISHWDPVARPNLLMEPALNADLPHGVDLTIDLLKDIGWPTPPE